VIIADTGGMLALLDADDRHHEEVVAAYEKEGERWVLPWAILPEIDYLAAKYLGQKVALEFASDIARGAFRVEGFNTEDMRRAVAIQKAHLKLKLGLVDAVVMAQAERYRALAIVTLDGRHFRAVSLKIAPPPKLIPSTPSPELVATAVVAAPWPLKSNV
jgi:predicted nucleic acid-binding protein